MEGITHVLHVASPITLSESATYEEFVNPVVAGTNSLIEGVKKHKVKKLIVTSTALTMIGG